MQLFFFVVCLHYYQKMASSQRAIIDAETDFRLNLHWHPLLSNWQWKTRIEMVSTFIFEPDDNEGTQHRIIIKWTKNWSNRAKRLRLNVCCCNFFCSSQVRCTMSAKPKIETFSYRSSTSLMCCMMCFRWKIWQQFSFWAIFLIVACSNRFHVICAFVCKRCICFARIDWWRIC